MISFFRKYHKWLGLFASIFLIVFSISGIILNHRGFFSSIDVDRNWMPKEYRYNNWNNASVRSAIHLSDHETLLYGNIGLWLTDTSFTSYTDFSKGFPKGIDHKKIDIVFKDSQNRLLAGSLFGLYQYNILNAQWEKVQLPELDNPRIVDIIEKDQELWLLTRSELLISKDLQSFEVKHLPAPEGYDHKVSLFKTLWMIHSGEIFGLTGKLIVDLVALIFIFLTLTGLFYYFNRQKIKKRSREQSTALLKRNRFYLKWHNKIGWISLLILIITTFTGMFLRPPLLIPIATSKVGKLPYTHLDQVNPWFDQLRRIQFDESLQRITIGTIGGMYYSDDNLSSELKAYPSQPPISVMGINVLEQFERGYFLIGSFSGLFLWNPETGHVFDYIKKEDYQAPSEQGPPIGDYMTAGYFRDQKQNEYVFDYNLGLLQNYPIEMPKAIIDQSPISLWNMSVEYHTARIYKFILGPFYILIVPLIGLINLFILISGFWVWWKKFR